MYAFAPRISGLAVGIFLEKRKRKIYGESMMLDFSNLPLKSKIYYQDDAAVIYNCDNREILPLFPDKAFDLVLTDPPYNALNIGPNKRE